MAGFFRNRWWVVFASICGLMVGSGAINIFAFGVFLKPVTEDLHVGIFEVMLVVTCILLAPLGPYPYPARGRVIAGTRQKVTA